MKASDAKKFIGQEVKYLKASRNWEPCIGVVQETQGRNILIENDWYWAPDILWMKLVEKQKGE